MDVEYKTTTHCLTTVKSHLWNPTHNFNPLLSRRKYSLIMVTNVYNTKSKGEMKKELYSEARKEFFLSLGLSLTNHDFGLGQKKNLFWPHCSMTLSLLIPLTDWE